MGYGSKSSDIREGASLGHGVHKKVNLVEVKKHITEPKKGADAGYDVLDYIFKNKKGDQYVYRIFNPEGGDDETKVAKAQKDASDKVVYIASKISNKEVELNGDKINSWDDFTTEAIALLPEGFEKIDLDIKLVGSVYQGKANVGAPNIYQGGWIGGGWIKRSDSKDELTLSEQDKKSIAQYEETIKKSSNSAPAGAAPAMGSGDGDVVF